MTADGDVVIPIDAETFWFWLKAAFGAPTTTGAGPYDHAFTSGNFDLPSMARGAGMPEVPRFAMYSGCKLDQLSWQMQRSGQLQATASLVAQGEARAATSQAGTLDALTLKRFGNFNGAVKRDGRRLATWRSAEVTYSNNLDRIETIRSDGRIDGADPSIAALTGQIEVRSADETLVDQAVNGTPPSSSSPSRWPAARRSSWSRTRSTCQRCRARRGELCRDQRPAGRAGDLRLAGVAERDQGRAPQP